MQEGGISRQTKTEFGGSHIFLPFVFRGISYRCMYIEHSVFHVYFTIDSRGFTDFYSSFFGPKQCFFFCVLEETWISQIDTMVNLT